MLRLGLREEGEEGMRRRTSCQWMQSGVTLPLVVMFRGTRKCMYFTASRMDADANRKTGATNLRE